MTTVTVAELLADKAKQSGSHALYSLPPAAPVAHAVTMMATKKISSVLVMDGDKMLGLITLRELLYGLHANDNSLVSATCAHIMKANPPVAKDDDSIDYLRGLMTELHITHVPVMHGESLRGILSFHDIARSAIKDAAFENKLLKQYIKNWPE
jgi:CBS domain-containing protein